MGPGQTAPVVAAPEAETFARMEREFAHVGWLDDMVLVDEPDVDDDGPSGVFACV